MAEQGPSFVPAGYSIIDELGSGRTAHVYLAAHSSRPRLALKLPRRELAEQPVLRRLFENEVQITLGLRHSNVVAGFDGAPTGSGAFLALEYCAGGTLGELLHGEKGLPLATARKLIIGVARGLEHSHSRQVLHRDVKPANVFLDEAGTAKLGDFGTGMHLGDDSGERVGTAFYMAPEIFEGRSSTVRSDIYSLGILAYELIAGKRPFLGETYADLMVAHTSGFPRALTHHREELSRPEARVIATAMARDPNKRYSSVREFREAFMAAAGIDEPEPPTTTALTGRASRKPRPNDDGRSDGKHEEKSGSNGLFGWLKRKRND